MIPDSVTAIADSAFDGCDALVITCIEDSYAHQYALAHDIPYVLVVYILGDADGDGAVSILDATCIQRRLVNLPVASFVERAADVDGDGLNILDATQVQRYLAGFQNPYGIGQSFT